MISKILKDFNLYVDGNGYAGRVAEITPPKLALKMDEFRGGGMDASIEHDVGMEKLEADFTLREYDMNTLRLFGVQIGLNIGFRIAGSIQSPATGLAEPVSIALRGRIKSLEQGTWKQGEPATLKVMVACSYYKYTQAGQDLIEIDVEGMRRLINGVDQLAQTRLNLGIV